MAIIVHVHKRTTDETGAELTKKIDAAWVEIEALEKSGKGKTGAELELIIRKITAAKRSANELEDRLRTYKKQGKGLDHRLDFVTPATDAERRSRIQEVVRNTGCTSAVALRWLEAEEWIVDTTVRELKHAMRLGFTVDATRDAAGKANAAQVNNGLSLASEIQQLLERKGESMNANDMTNALMALSGVARVLRSA